MGLLVTLGWVCLLVGLVLVVLGYTVESRALRPGWGVAILGVVLLIVGYLLPALDGNTAEYDAGHEQQVVRPD